MKLTDKTSWLAQLDQEELLSVRRKFWTFVIWPKDEDINNFDDFAKHEFRKELCKSLGNAIIPAVISPVHDQDVKEDGTLAKPHCHVVIFFDSPQRFKFVLKFLQYRLGMDRIKYVEPVYSMPAMNRYLCHIDNPEKVLYDVEDVITLNGASYVLEDETASELVVNTIINNGFTSITSCLCYFEANPPARKWIVNSPGIVRTLCKEQKDSKKMYTDYLLDELENKNV